MPGLIPLALLLVPVPAAPPATPGDPGLHAAARVLVEARWRQAETRAAGYAALAARNHVPQVWSERVAGAARDLARLADLLAAARPSEPNSAAARPVPARVAPGGSNRNAEVLFARHRERLTRAERHAVDTAAAWEGRARRLAALIPAGAATAAERDAAAAAAAVARAEAAFARARLRTADDAAVSACKMLGFVPDGGEVDLLVGAAEIRLAALALTARAAALREAAAAASELAGRLRPLAATGAAPPAEVAAAARTAEAARAAADEAEAAAAVLDGWGVNVAGPTVLVPLPAGLAPLTPFAG